MVCFREKTVPVPNTNRGVNGDVNQRRFTVSWCPASTGVLRNLMHAVCALAAVSQAVSHPCLLPSCWGMSAFCFVLFFLAVVEERLDQTTRALQSRPSARLLAESQRRLITARNVAVGAHDRPGGGAICEEQIQRQADTSLCCVACCVLQASYAPLVAAWLLLEPSLSYNNKYFE